MARVTRKAKRKISNDDKKSKAGKELKKELDNDLSAALALADDHEARVEILLTQIIRELKAIKVK